MQSRENLLLYVSLFGVPVAQPSSVSLYPSAPFPFLYPSPPTIVRIGFPTYTLYNSQIPQTMTSPFCSTPFVLFVSFSPPRLSLLASALLIFILTYTYIFYSVFYLLSLSPILDRSFFLLIYHQRLIYTKYREVILNVFLFFF